MGSRYGRNQKRKAREEIARLQAEAKYNHDKATYNVQQATLARIAHDKLVTEVENWDAEIQAVLGPYSCLRFETTTMAADHPTRELPRFKRIDPINYARDFEPGRQSQSLDAFRERMLRYVTEIERDPYQPRFTFRIIETNGSRDHVAYCVSEETMRQRGMTERDILWFTHEMARNLIDHLNSERVKRRA